MHVPMLALLLLCPWKGTASTGPRGEASKKRSYCINRMSKPGSRHTIGCCAPNFGLGLRGCAGKSWRCIPEPLLAILQLIKPVKFSPRRTQYNLWVCFFGWELEGSGTDAGSTTTVQNCFTRPLFFQPSSRVRVDLLSYESKPTDKQEQYDRMAEENWTGEG